MNHATSFGEWLRQRRQALDLSRKELAACVGCSHSLIEKLELGERKPSRQIAELLADCLNIASEERPAFISLARWQPDADEADEHGTTETNLPTPLTPLLGREETVASIRELLLSEGSRLVTLVGAPGIGKTRVALEVAKFVLREFGDGVLFVALSPIRSADLVIPTIAQAVDVSDSSGEPILPVLVERLKGKKALLLLDNFEQVVEAGPNVAEVIAECSQIKVLVTSREALRVRGEQQYPIEPLDAPDLANLPGEEELARYPAIALFVERARAVRPDFVLNKENARAIAAICVRLNGLPLAIELVAARCKLLSPEMLLSMLDSRLVLLTQGPRDLPERHQTLWHAIDASYELLKEEERTLFTRMGVFSGGCTLAAVQAVCYVYSDQATDALDVVMSLLDKSLLQREDRGGELRLTMLEMIRQYAAQLLEASGEAATIRRNHAEYYLALAEAAGPLLSGSEQGLWLTKLEEEHDNLRLALDWALDNGETEIAARLAVSLRYFWDMKGYLTEGRKRLGQVLEHSEGFPARLRADVAYSVGALAQAQGDLKVAEQWLQVSIAIRKELGDSNGTASALSVLGLVAMDQGDFDRAAEYFEMCLGIKREAQDKLGLANILVNLGLLELYRENFAQAVVYMEESLPLYRELDDRRGIAATLTNFAEAARFMGDYDRASTLFVEALKLGWELDAKHIILACLGGLATVETARKHPLRASWLYGVEETLRLAVGAPLPPVDQAEYEQCVEETRSRMDEEAFARAWEEGRAMPLEQVIGRITDSNGDL